MDHAIDRKMVEIESLDNHIDETSSDLHIMKKPMKYGKAMIPTAANIVDFNIAIENNKSLKLHDNDQYPMSRMKELSLSHRLTFLHDIGINESIHEVR